MPYADPERRKEVVRQSKAKARAEQKEGQTEKKNIDVRARAWTFIVYPESAPDNWREILDGYFVPWSCSPLHDSDLNAIGEPKKSHWHILMSFAGKKSYTQIMTISERICGTSPQICHDQKGLVRYFTHRDNPEKAQYRQQDIEAHNGFDLEEYLKPTTSECMAMQDEMVAWCFKNRITDFADLKVYALHERPDWSRELCRSCFQITQFIKSMRHRGDKPIYNPETGEVYE